MVSIITVNYNGYNDTCELVESLRRNETYPYELIVVDNASVGDDAKKLKAKYSDITVVASDRNLGFCGGNNLGYQYSKGDYILYLNNDIIVRQPMLETLVARMKTSEKIGAVSPKIKYEFSPTIIQYAGFTEMNMFRVSNAMIGVGQSDVGQYNTPNVTPFIHGAAVLTSRQVIETAGMMSDLYFLFYEELDWSIQLKERGYELWYEPKSEVYHKESMTIVRGTPQRNYYLCRSRMLFARRRNSGVTLILALTYQLLISFPGNVMRWALRRDWRMIAAISRGVFDGLRMPKS